ncbi:class I mannose-6-phosphate isomerase [Sphingomonas sediminicola]|uniref:class I mannose-6-phosphate isomerase n=1 Tax=Sphingomonas sediminicola TaxID=386874 RepID=UPI0031B59F86
MKLQRSAVEKPWGRTDLDPVFGTSSAQRVGEIWFTHAELADPPLLVKYIFTSENLSVQVHPSDDEARARGLASGKNESWYILNADDGARLGLGLKAAVTEDELRAAAINGSIEQMLDWRPVEAGDFFYVPAGTIHAIGAGIALMEIQQNADVTYRLYDYGRPRELHLDDAVSVSQRKPYVGHSIINSSTSNDRILVDEASFSVIRASSTEGIPQSLASRQRWVMPLHGSASSGTEGASIGECLLLQPRAPLSLSPDALVLVAVAGRI